MADAELNIWNKSDSIHHDRHHRAAKGPMGLIRPVSLRANHVYTSRDVAFIQMLSVTMLSVLTV